MYINFQLGFSDTIQRDYYEHQSVCPVEENVCVEADYSQINGGIRAEYGFDVFCILFRQQGKCQQQAAYASQVYDQQENGHHEGDLCFLIFLAVEELSDKYENKSEYRRKVE